jgi:glycosyltransferase involved in cell wall biosynthesis
MKILFCCSTHLSKELGASKVLIELAEEMERLGWECTLKSRYDIAPGAHQPKDYSQQLRRYLIEHAKEYDVVDYDHGHLPYPRSDFPATTLFVARSVLLGHHFDSISIPRERGLKARLRAMLYDRSEQARRRDRTERARVTVREADLVNVLNQDDLAALVSAGVPQERIVVIPNGISRSRRALFDAVSSVPPRDPVVVFVGTFDTRKGATDFPRLVEEISDGVPDVRFRLLGTYKDEQAVKHRFPRRLRSRIEVLPRFAADALPELLSTGSVGIFPSYLEGFGLGVLEMLAASIPVIAYNSPGPPAMLPSNYLVQPGDCSAMSGKVIALLRDKEELARARCWAKERSKQFSWENIAKLTSEAYIRQRNCHAPSGAEAVASL